MDLVLDLWLPILLSAVFVFVVSSILHMLIPFHCNDYKTMPGEEKVMAEMRAQSVAPGQYMFPRPGSVKEMSSPEMIAKYKQGPVGTVTVLPNGPPAMTKNLVLWFLYSLVISFFVAYVTSLAVPRGADYRAVFRVVGAVAVIGYALPSLTESIWKGQSWSTTGKFIFDGVVYSLVTAGTFGWLWPAAA